MKYCIVVLIYCCAAVRAHEFVPVDYTEGLANSPKEVDAEEEDSEELMQVVADELPQESMKIVRKLEPGAVDDIVKDFEEKTEIREEGNIQERMQHDVENTDQADSDSFRCSFLSGDGSGASEEKIGLQTGDECVKACIAQKKIDDSINGVTMYQNEKRGGCYCEKTMAGVSSSSAYKTCFLEDSSKISGAEPRFKVGTPGTTRCPKNYELVKDRIRCETDAWRFLNKTLEPAGCWKFLYSGCVYTTSGGIFFNTCAKLSTARHHSAVCERIEPGRECTIHFYQKEGFRGRRTTYSRNGYKVNENYVMLSLRMHRGCCVKIYEHQEYQGKSRLWCQTKPTIRRYWSDWSSKKFSFKIVKDDWY